MIYQNPFSVVKATEYSDTQISDLYVPYGDESDKNLSFYNLMQPRSITPKFILGSKGCGKTHILRFYSYECRLKQYNNDIRKLLKNDKYIGLYSRLDGLSSARFCVETNGGNRDAWVATYDYYFELYHGIIALKLMQQIVDALDVPDVIINNAMHEICRNVELDIVIGTISEMIDYLDALRINIDKEIRLYAHTRKLNMEVVVSKFNFGTLIFEIPRTFVKYIPDLNGVNIIYILDEYEKLQEEWQKESLNTLVYERKYNVSFWVGARKTGYRTRTTKMKEVIRDGHEYQLVDLDFLLKKDEKMYAQFAEKMFAKRLENANITGILGHELFECYSEENFLKSLLGKELLHWNRLRDVLQKAGCSNKSVENMLIGLKYGVEDNPLEQKGKIYSFYKQWSKEKNDINEERLIEIVAQTNESFCSYKKGKNKKYQEMMDKFRQDFRAQLAVENKVKLNQYSGFDEIITASDCNPRVFLTLLKLIIEDCIFRGINVFDGQTKIPLHSQYMGINETARWFLNDIEIYGEDRETLMIAIGNLIQFFYDCRFCDKPTETSLCAFYYRENKNLLNVKKIIEIAAAEGFLVEIPKQRKDKTLHVPQRTYQLNRLLAILYILPIARRGVRSITPDMLRAIFDVNYQDRFKIREASIKKKLNAPFGGVRAKEEIIVQEPTLFDKL